MTKQRSKLAKAKHEEYKGPEQDQAKKVAFTLLDALTKSGAILLTHVEFHTFLAATHSFQKTVMDTIVMDNMNPIEALEASAMIMNAVVHQVSDVKSLLQPSLISHAETFHKDLLQLDEITDV